eukprot:GHVO01042172.1.p1 GENE.GHVO01042172.1~~GHVO01042172.1.p1  ORF type:complete len:479 (+),score=43.05 GHVO01042172.1:1546-2982(+)
MFVKIGYANFVYTSRYYEGPMPILMTNDLDFLTEVLIRNFNKFHARKYFPLQPNPVTHPVCSILLAEGQRWKRLRTISSSTFTSSKLKHATSMMVTKAEKLMKKLEDIARAGESCDLKPLLQELTLDVIGEAALGIDINAQGDANTPLLTAARDVVEQNALQVNFLVALPSLRFRLFGLYMFISRFISFTDFMLIESVGKVLEMRRKEPQRNPPDLMQLMIDAEVTNHNGPLEISMDDEHSSEERKESVDIEMSEIERKKHAGELAKTKLTTEEIKIQGVLFLVAGYETTSTALSFCSYVLAMNPDKQELLFEEVDQNMGNEEDLTYDKVQGLSYLDMVLRETLRMYPPGALIVNRRCTEPCTIKGLNIPEGMVIQANVWNIHYDPDIWGPTDPNVFEPERFTSERRAKMHPLVWLPFGAGPRNCIGLRFALLEAKIALVKLIKKFRIVPCEQTTVPLELGEVGVIGPKNVTVGLELR